MLCSSVSRIKSNDMLNENRISHIDSRWIYHSKHIH